MEGGGQKDSAISIYQVLEAGINYCTASCQKEGVDESKAKRQTVTDRRR